MDKGFFAEGSAGNFEEYHFIVTIPLKNVNLKGKNKYYYSWPNMFYFNLSLAVLQSQGLNWQESYRLTSY
jgi:hypothetical protein